MAVHKLFVSNPPDSPKVKSSSRKKANVKKAIGIITSKTQYYFLNFQMSKKRFFFWQKFQAFSNFQKLKSK